MISNVAVIGAGTMGHGIAHVFAAHGYKVSIYEPFEKVRLSAMDKIKEELQFLLDEQCITFEKMSEALNNITVFDDLTSAVVHADYVIEACPEVLEIKKELFSSLDMICKPEAVLASNTSSLKLSDIMADLPDSRKGFCMICHWYNPPYLIPIVELSMFGNMTERVFSEVYELYENCEKRPVRVLKDVTGMIANRLLHAQAREAFTLVENGVASAEDVDKALKFGPCFRNATTGMLEVADMGGLDIWCSAEDNIFPALNNSDSACGEMRSLVENGDYGIKTGKGFYDYSGCDQDSVQKAFYKRLVTQLKASKNY